MSLARLSASSIAVAAVVGGGASVWQHDDDLQGEEAPPPARPGAGLGGNLTAIDLVPLAAGGAAALACGAADGFVSVGLYAAGTGLSPAGAPFSAHAGGRWGGVSALAFCEAAPAGQRTILLTAGEANYKLCLWSVDVTGGEPPSCIHSLAVPDLPGVPPRAPLLWGLEKSSRTLLLVSSAAVTAAPSTILALRLGAGMDR